MKTRSSRFLLSGLIIAWAFDLIFYKKPFGIGFSIWIVLCLMVLFVLGAIEKVKPAWQTILLATITVLLASAPLFRLETMTRLLSVGAALLSLMLTAATYHNGFWLWFRLYHYIVQYFNLILAAISRAWVLIFPPREENGVEKALPARRTGLWSVVRGLALALPVLLIFSALLASADPIFNNGLKSFLAIFKIENLAEYLFRFFYILLFAYLFAGTLLFALQPKKDQEKPDPSQGWVKTFLGNIEANVILTAVNILFLTFLIIQFRYFFGGQANITTSGFTYSEYARRGFNELIAVTVISTLLYLLLNGITNANTPAQRMRMTILNTLLFAQLLVILYSAFQRLSLYEAAYGFSQLRTYSTFFIPWLAVFIVSLIVLEILRKQGRFALSLLLTALGFIATLTLINVDSFIAVRNIQRAEISSQEGYALDYNYLSQLSNDAVPAVFDAYRSINADIAQAAAAFLTCRWDSLNNQSDKPWQGFNFSDQKAYTLLQSQSSIWDWYPITPAESYSGKSVLVDGKSYDCVPVFTGID